MKSLRRLALAPAFLSLLVGVLHAQSPDPGDPRKRLIFQPGQKEPDLQATPSPTPDPVTTDPFTAIRNFFAALQSGTVDAAYDGLVKNTIIAEKTENVSELKARTKQAIDSYGPVRGYETIRRVEAGKSLLRETCISLNEDLPLRWRFYFYKTPNGWKLVDLRVDDGLVELFDEVTQKRDDSGKRQ